MRKLIIISFLLFAFFSGNTQPVNKYTQDIAMPSPEAASISKFSEIPVSYYTGVPNITVPIHTLQEGSLSLPISLSYHSSGVKVAETASWVGMNWTLNAGGMISRTVQNGKDEEAGYGWLYTPSIPTPPSYNPYNNTWTGDYCNFQAHLTTG